MQPIKKNKNNGTNLHMDWGQGQSEKCSETKPKWYWTEWSRTRNWMCSNTSLHHHLHKDRHQL